MLGASGTALFGITLLSAVQVTAAQESAGVIIAGVVAGVLLLLLCVGVVIVCFYKRRGFNERDDKHKRPTKHKVFVANGAPPPPPQYYPKRHPANGFIHQMSAPRMPPPPLIRSRPMPAPPPPVFVQQTPVPTVNVPYATYHGPPPEMRYQMKGPERPGTMSGPPPIVIPFETAAGSGGTVTVRPDPRPVVHKRSKYKKRERIDTQDDHRRSPNKHRSTSRQRSQEFVVQQSYDGIPVIRPVIYIDDDDDDRPRHRSKSRERRTKSSSSRDGAQITEIKLTTENRVKEVHAVAEINTDQPTPSRLLTPPASTKERSRASSVTEAVNALRMSVEGHADGDSDSNVSHSSKAPSFGWAQTERAPDPVAGDVLFYPAGASVETSRNTEPHVKPKDEIYSYTKLIKSSTKERAPSPESPVHVPEPKPDTYGGYEVPKDLRRSIAGTRDEERKYQTEHSPATGPYTDIGASMSDRLQYLVEDGDKSRFSHYNVGAIDFADEDGEQEEPVQMRVKRPETPPVDIPRESFYSKVNKRPKTPENDIPLVSPRESTEVPPLNLRSTVGSPRDDSNSYRPATPPKDFPITPQSSFTKKRPETPPTDFPITPKGSFISPRPPTPPYDVLDTSRLGETARSTAVDPATGAPGSFQARQRLIEAHLQKNTQSGPSPGAPTSKPVQNSVPKPLPSSLPPPPPVPIVNVTPGVVPPAPPPPPIPK